MRDPAGPPDRHGLRGGLRGVPANLRACDRVWVAGYPGPVGAWRPVPEVTTGALAAVAPDFTVGTPVAFDDVVVTLWVADQPPSGRGVRFGNSSG